MSGSVLDEKFTLADLLDPAALEEVLQAYADCFGLGVTILDEDGQEALEVCPAHAFCDSVRKSEAKAQCDGVKKRIARHPLEDSQVLQIKSFCSMRYSLFPLTHQLENFGRVIVGPFRDPKLDPEVSQGMVKDKGGGVVDLEAIEKVTSLGQDRLKEAVKLLARILDAFLFINAKRLITTRLHLDAVFSDREKIFKQVELQDSGSQQDKEEIEKLKNMF